MNTYVQPFNFLLDGYEEIGVILSEVLAAQTEFMHSGNRQIVLVFIYDQILDFHINMLRYTSRKCMY